jgi:hypothetical protein
MNEERPSLYKEKIIPKKDSLFLFDIDKEKLQL